MQQDFPPDSVPLNFLWLTFGPALLICLSSFKATSYPELNRICLMLSQVRKMFGKGYF